MYEEDTWIEVASIWMGSR
ncbi:unnamed protein product [Cuscuta europaea]|uniref:Uncharacterized protein n=1 Tax=Cuscuta europaea TaxID=41803 RepID=A0A9P0ZV16_CUSEU|nr:unnamed protein product [Cuscuta europaea]